MIKGFMVQTSAIVDITVNGVTLNNLKIVSEWEGFFKLIDENGLILIVCTHNLMGLPSDIVRYGRMLWSEPKEFTLIKGSPSLIGEFYPEKNKASEDKP